MHVSFGVWFARAGLTLLLIWMSVALLAAAAWDTVDDIVPEIVQLRLFALGVLAWMGGIGWGVWINGRPLPGGHAQP